MRFLGLQPKSFSFFSLFAVLLFFLEPLAHGACTNAQKINLTQYRGDPLKSEKIYCTGSFQAYTLTGGTLRDFSQINVESDEIHIQNEANFFAVYGSQIELSSMLRSGDDQITVSNNNSPLLTEVSNGQLKGVDVHFISGDYINDSFDIIAGNDKITVTGSNISQISGDTLTNSLSSQAGHDEILILDSTLHTLMGDEILSSEEITAGNDKITLKDSKVLGNIYGNFFKDHPFILSSGKAGNDQFILENTTVQGSLIGDAFFTSEGESYKNTSFIQSGNHDISLKNTVIEGDLYTGNGTDRVTLYEGSKILGTLDGGDDASATDGSDDWLILNHLTEHSSTLKYKNFERITLRNNSTFFLEETGESPSSASFTVEQGSRLSLKDTPKADYSLKSTLINEGMVTLSTPSLSLSNSITSGQTGSVLRLTGNGAEAAGDLEGSGVFRLDADLNAKSPTADKIIVQGQIKARGLIEINDLTNTDYDLYKDTSNGGKEALALKGTKVTLIEAPNDPDKSDEDFSFTLAQRYNRDPKQGRFDRSPFVWALKTEGNNWILSYQQDPRPEQQGSSFEEPPLTSVEILAEIPAYAALPTLGQRLNLIDLNRVHNYLSQERDFVPSVNRAAEALDLRTPPFQEFKTRILSFWSKTDYSGLTLKPHNSFNLQGNSTGFTAGLNAKVSLPNKQTLMIGLFGGTATGQFSTQSFSAETLSQKIYTKISSDILFNSSTIGLYTNFIRNKTSLEALASYSSFKAQIETPDFFATNSGQAYSFSTKISQSFALGSSWTLTPYGQVSYVSSGWNNIPKDNPVVRFQTAPTLNVGLGIDINKSFLGKKGVFQIQGSFATFYETGKNKLIYAGLPLQTNPIGLSQKSSLALTYQRRQKMTFSGGITYGTNFSSSREYRARFGMAFRW